ncbi:MAG TPA: HepT-like ribonuclease domain-containing protein [Thermoanaerobaculia bacterium]|nr:HepT-like ribonuclease domain-containing protein [Thermoanaerobaculia bacterium]
MQLSSELKERYAEFNWRRIAAFRNVLAHNILDLSPRRVWDVITDHLPPLKRQVTRILADLP